MLVMLKSNRPSILVQTNQVYRISGQISLTSTMNRPQPYFLSKLTINQSSSYQGLTVLDRQPTWMVSWTGLPNNHPSNACPCRFIRKDERVFEWKTSDDESSHGLDRKNI